MKAEHCVKEGFRTEFLSVNYGLLTWPCKEWGIVVDGDTVPLKDRRSNRHIPVVADLLQGTRAVESKLTRPEVIAFILYTGPMVS